MPRSTAVGPCGRPCGEILWGGSKLEVDDAVAREVYDARGDASGCRGPCRGGGWRRRGRSTAREVAALCRRGFDEHLADVRGVGRRRRGPRRARQPAGASEGEFHQRAVAHALVEVRVELHLGQRATRGELSRATLEGIHAGSSADASATSRRARGRIPHRAGRHRRPRSRGRRTRLGLTRVRRGDVAPRRRHLAVAPQRDRQTLLETEVVAPNLVRASVVKRVSGRGARRSPRTTPRFSPSRTPEGGGNQPRRQSTARESEGKRSFHVPTEFSAQQLSMSLALALVLTFSFFSYGTQSAFLVVFQVITSGPRFAIPLGRPAPASIGTAPPPSLMGAASMRDAAPRPATLA